MIIRNNNISPILCIKTTEILKMKLINLNFMSLNSRNKKRLMLKGIQIILLKIARTNLISRPKGLAYLLRRRTMIQR